MNLETAGEVVQAIGSNLHLSRNHQETAQGFTHRVMVSAAGRIFLAALWDSQEKGKYPSVQHVKQRTLDTCTVFQQLKPYFFSDKLDISKLVEDIYDIYTANGFLYHAANEVRPARPCQADLRTVRLLRGSFLEEKVSMSGLGLFQPKEEKTEGFIQLGSCFGLPSGSLAEDWKRCLEHVSWHLTEVESSFSYLNIVRKNSSDYWSKNSDRSGKISILTTSPDTFYLYRWIQRNQLEISPIPSWKTENGGIYSLAVGLLQERRRLPSIKYHSNRSLVIVRPGYLLPPPELRFFQLYSWPSTINKFDDAFNRIMQVDVFLGFKAYLESRGYVFEEEDAG
jgi:hypothetical protein